MYITEIFAISAFLLTFLIFLRTARSNKKTDQAIDEFRKSIKIEIVELEEVVISAIRKFELENFQHFENIQVSINDFKDRMTFIEAFIYFSKSAPEPKVIEKPKISRSEGAKKMWARRKLKEMANREE